MNDRENLKAIPLFSDMDEHEIAGIRAAMEPQYFVAGQTIIHEGEEGDLFHVIISGNVEYLTSDADGRELIIDEAGPGDFFGELSMITGEPRAIRVRAKDAVHTLGLHRKDFHEFLLKHPHAGIDVMTVLGRRLYYTDKLLRSSIVKNVNQVFEDKKSVGQRVADAFAAMMGSWSFIICQSAILIVWVTLNVVGWVQAWDPYPFILLNLTLSFQAAYAAPIIMMSQNRQADKDRLAAEIDHDTNVRAEIKTGLIMNRLDDMEKSLHEIHKKLQGT